jgi:dihydrolipoamide dehydrogenase
VDYHAIPHAVFTDPEVASVGLTESQAIEKYGDGGLLVGRYDYKNTAKGEAIGAEDGRVKVVVRSAGLEIVGAHIVGPQASILIQEIVSLLYTPDRGARPILEGMHIHPALSEVVERAFLSLVPARDHGPRGHTTG